MNLLELFEESQKKVKVLNEEQEKLDEKVEYRNLIADIIKGEEYHIVGCKKLYDKIGVKYESHILIGFSFKLNKTNIKKIQKYFEKEYGNEL